MISRSDLTCSFLVVTTVLGVAHARADELLPPPIPTLRIGAPTSEPETVRARRVELTPETITEKYPNRKVKIERQVVQDDERNYVNHGPWKMWDPNGKGFVLVGAPIAFDCAISLSWVHQEMRTCVR